MDTGQVDTEYFEDQMRQTRVRLDRKLDALNARTSGARQQISWAMPALSSSSEEPLAQKSTITA